jgi:hypothetical protein
VCRTVSFSKPCSASMASFSLQQNMHSQVRMSTHGGFMQIAGSHQSSAILATEPSFDWRLSARDSRPNVGMSDDNVPSILSSLAAVSAICLTANSLVCRMRQLRTHSLYLFLSESVCLSVSVSPSVQMRQPDRN